MSARRAGTRGCAGAGGAGFGTWGYLAARAKKKVQNCNRSLKSDQAGILMGCGPIIMRPLPAIAGATTREATMFKALLL